MKRILQLYSITNSDQKQTQESSFNIKLQTKPKIIEIKEVRK